jgi:hypothetical protein
MSQTNDLLSDISGKLDKVLRLLALDAVKNCKTEHDKIELLDSLGFRPMEIGKLLSKTADNVSVQLSLIRKKKEKASKKAKQTANQKTEDKK